jgi:hypothetical protein
MYNKFVLLHSCIPDSFVIAVIFFPFYFIPKFIGVVKINALIQYLRQLFNLQYTVHVLEILY